MGYLHIGMNVMVDPRRVIGIFDLDNTSTSKLTRRFLDGAEKEGVVQSACDPSWCATTPITGRSSIYRS